MRGEPGNIRFAPAIPAHDQLGFFGWGLLAICFRLALALCSPIISRDGVYYTDLALMINTEQWLSQVGDWFLFNPYPPLIALFARSGFGYDFSGQLVNVLCSGLAVVPMAFWMASAFGTRQAHLASALYALHPILAITGSDVAREGVYWLALFLAVYFSWAATQSSSLWRYALAGCFCTIAMLTRIEGAGLFLLLASWSFSRREAWSWVSKPLLGTAIAWGMLPLIWVACNLILIPEGGGWRGAGRLTQYFSGSHSPALQNSAPRTSTLQIETKIPRSVHELADSLPIWSPQGVPDLEQQRIRRFLILADDHRPAVFAARLFAQFWNAYQLPLLVVVGFAIYYRREWWSGARDLPLGIYGLVITAAVTWQLIREHILEARYLFVLMPMIYPLVGIGCVKITSILWTRLQARSPRLPYRLATATTLGLLVYAGGVAFHGISSDKLPQKVLGERLKESMGPRLVIAGPESEKRLAHYADAVYVILPVDQSEVNDDWFRKHQVQILVTKVRSKGTRSLAASEDEAYPRILKDEPGLERYSIQLIQQPPARSSLLAN